MTRVEQYEYCIELSGLTQSQFNSKYSVTKLSWITSCTALSEGIRKLASDINVNLSWLKYNTEEIGNPIAQDIIENYTVKNWEFNQNAMDLLLLNYLYDTKEKYNNVYKLKESSVTGLSLDNNTLYVPISHLSEVQSYLEDNGFTVLEKNDSDGNYYKFALNRYSLNVSGEDE